MQSWAFNDNLLLVGFLNASVSVLSLDYATGTLTPKQVITFNSPALVVGRTSRFAACGLLDGSVYIYSYNLASGQYELNQTITSDSNSGCSSMDFSVGENRIVAARFDLSFDVFERNSTSYYNKVYTTSNAHTDSFLRVLFDTSSVYLLTTSTDNTTKLWTLADGYSTGTSYNIKGASIDYSDAYGEFAVGANVNAGGTIDFETLNATNCQNGNSATNSAACNCANPEQWNNGKCTNLDCSPIPYANGLATDNSSCNCVAGYKWDSVVGNCRRDCATDTNSNGTNF